MLYRALKRAGKWCTLILYIIFAKGWIDMSYERDKISYMIGKRIKELRVEKKMSQEQLALGSGIHPAYLGRVERGEKCASVETIFKLSKGLNVPASTIIDFDEPISVSKEKTIKRIEHILSELTDEMAADLADIVEKIAKIYSKKK